MAFSSQATLRCNTKDTAALLGDDKFLALETEVSIIPKFSNDRAVECIKGQFGPFRAHTAAKVPLWAALEMDRLQKCTIELPDWLHEEELKRMREDERKNTDRFMKVPDHYIEIAFAFLDQSKAFVNEPRKKRRTTVLLRELIEERRLKIIKGLKQFDSTPMEINVTDMSSAELTCFRTRSLHALDKFLDLLRSRNVADVEQGLIEGSQAEGTQMEDSSSRPL
uniref:DNA replication complex GINS protein PSF2 n=1 Tax=Alexandrium monilatum TaxID=311494 RepID=A0A7S4QGY2_9DINO|mmetsp:Transcript_42148/g.126060  ORF Transcript_42148/g.126060 Transcript_42148/m.126060 type:complete len:223 (-) Transcript_42148:117-785(-)